MRNSSEKFIAPLPTDCTIDPHKKPVIFSNERFRLLDTREDTVEKKKKQCIFLCAKIAPSMKSGSQEKPYLNRNDRGLVFETGDSIREQLGGLREYDLIVASL